MAYMTFTDALMQAKRYAFTGSEGPVGVRTASTASNRFSERPLRPMSKTPQPFNPTPAGAGTSPLSGYLGNDVITSELPQPFNPTPTPAGGGYEAIGRMQPDGSVMGPADYAAKGLIWNPAPAESFTAAPYPDWERDVVNGVTTNWGSYTPPASYVAWQAEQQKQAEQQRLGDTSGQSSAISWNSPFASDEQIRMLVDALMKLKLGG